MLIKRAMLPLVFDVSKPWLDVARIAKQILLINRVLVGLYHVARLARAISQPN